ncbi:MAG: WD40 repeat domain-containing protein [Limisphaerales bacterium]
MKTDPKKAHTAREYKCNAPLINGRFHPSGDSFFATAEDRTITRIDLKTEKQTIYEGHESWVRGIAFSKNDQTLITSGFDDTLIWWPAEGEKPKPIRKVKAHEGWIRAIAVSPDGQLIASAGNDRVIRLWNIEDGKKVRELKGHERDIYSLAWHSSGKHLISGDLMGKIHQWEVATGNLARSFEGKDLHTFNKGQDVDYGGVRSIAFNADESQLICGGLHKGTNPLGAINEPLILRFDWEKQELLSKHPAKGVRGVVWRNLVHPDGYLIAGVGGSGGGHLLFWNPEEEQPFHKFKLKDTVREMDLHPDGRQVGTVHWDKKVRINLLAAKETKKK